MGVVTSEYGVLREVLLCRPDNFQWSDKNPETANANAVVRETLRAGVQFDAQAAQRQHRELVDAFEQAGVACRFAEPDPALSYQVYTRDPAVMTPWGVLIGQMYRQQRRGEVAPTVRFYQAAGIPVWNWVTAGPLEGGDVHLIRPGLAAIGHTGIRTVEAAARQLAGWLEGEGWEARLVPFAEHFLHLDLFFAMVNERLALVCTDIADDAFLAWLKANRIEAVPVSYKDCMNLHGNCISVGGDRVISARGAVEVNARLRANGITVLDPDLSMYTQAGGGPRCMSMPLARDPV